MTPNRPAAFVEAEIVTPDALVAGRPLLDRKILTAASLEELRAKMGRLDEYAAKKAVKINRWVHYNWEAIHVLDPETDQYKKIDAISAGARRAAIEVFRFTWGITVRA